MRCTPTTPIPRDSPSPSQQALQQPFHLDAPNPLGRHLGMQSRADSGNRGFIHAGSAIADCEDGDCGEYGCGEEVGMGGGEGGDGEVEEEGEEEEGEGGGEEGRGRDGRAVKMKMKVGSGSRRREDTERVEEERELARKKIINSQPRSSTINSNPTSTTTSNPNPSRAPHETSPNKPLPRPPIRKRFIPTIVPDLSNYDTFGY
ncbi:hypothetical protein H4I95_04720 [Botrytis cinerea]